MLGGAEQIRSLFAYNKWANEKILENAGDLSDTEFESEFAASYGSMRGTLSHVLWAQVIWLARWEEREAPQRFVLERAGIANAFDESHRGLEQFANSLTDEDWPRLIDYVDSRRAKHSRPLGSLATHLVNHGTYHRGEAALMLTAAGHSPGDLDYVYFIPES